MEDLFNILSSSARINKSKRRKRENPSANAGSSANPRKQEASARNKPSHDDGDDDAIYDDTRKEAAAADGNNNNNNGKEVPLRSRDRTGKRDTSEEKRAQIHREEMATFRRSLGIVIADKQDVDLADPIASFSDLRPPAWWETQQQTDHNSSFLRLYQRIQANIEAGRWKEPTPIQMQSVPSLMHRRDVLAAAPTGSGKSGAFIIPALLLASAPYHAYYGNKTPGSDKSDSKNRAGEIRSLVLAPSLELASQLFREIERLGRGKPTTALLLQKSNAAHVRQKSAGGKRGLDVLVATPLRLVDALQHPDRPLDLSTVRMVVLDEADRLLDAADGGKGKAKKKEKDKSKETGRKKSDENDEDESEEDESDEDNRDGSEKKEQSGSSQTQTFLAQMDCILSQVPSTAVRCLFSATVTPQVRLVAESILRNPVDIRVGTAGQGGTAANTDIDQRLQFVSNEQGKLLAMRQLFQGRLGGVSSSLSGATSSGASVAGHIPWQPPVLVFLQSQDRAQALFEELLYDQMRVDVLHAGRSKAARERAVAKFRKGETWVLICTDLVARGVDFRAVNMVINYDLPAQGVTYIHRIGRTGRGGRKGTAVTLFTEADFGNLRTIANVMKQSGCEVPEWMLQLKKDKGQRIASRQAIDTTPAYDKKKKRKKAQMIRQSKEKKLRQQQKDSSDE